MTEEERTIFCSSFMLKPNKIFTYKGEEYKVDFAIIKRNCKYFEDNYRLFEQKVGFQAAIKTNQSKFVSSLIILVVFSRRVKKLYFCLEK